MLTISQHWSQHVEGCERCRRHLSKRLGNTRPHVVARGLCKLGRPLYTAFWRVQGRRATT